MARITIVTPAGAGTRTGNLHTAQRYARLLRAVGYRVSVVVMWDGKPCDLMIALHARRSHDSILECKKRFPGIPVIVVLTGTDLYRDLPDSAEARHSLALADRVIVLQEDALRLLAAPIRKKASVVYQSSSAKLRHRPPRRKFRVAVVGHLREEKDPFRAAQALALLEESADLELVQLGAALSPPMKSEAGQRMKRDARYRWLGSVQHARALRWIAASHLLVVSSAMEGGANVICEAARIGTPVLASRVSGNIGMLGRGYPGYYALFDARALARLLLRVSCEKKFYEELKRAVHSRRQLFSPAAERAALARVVRESLGRRA